MSPLNHTPSTTPVSPAHTAAPEEDRRRSRRRAAAGVLSAGVLIGATLCAGAVPASAATTVSVEDGVLQVSATAGKENNISVALQTVSADEKYYQVLDLGDTLIAGPGCIKDGEALRCAITADLTLIRVDTRDLKDTVTAGAEVFSSMEVYAGSGDDTVITGRGSDTIYGDSGDDTIQGNRGNDTIDGGRGNDTLSGGAGKDRLDGDRGNDDLTGGGQKDELLGGPGEDVLKSKDRRWADEVDGGSDEDICTTDRRDRTVNCEA